MISLQDRIMGHPISDPAYMAHLRTADVFNEVHAARNAFFREQERAVRARIAEENARTRYEAAIAKAKLMESMEGWD